MGDSGIKLTWKKRRTIDGKNIIIDFILSYSVIGNKHRRKKENIFK